MNVSKSLFSLSYSAHFHEPLRCYQIHEYHYDACVVKLKIGLESRVQMLILSSTIQQFVHFQTV